MNKQEIVISGLGQTSVMGKNIEELKTNFQKDYVGFLVDDSYNDTFILGKVVDFDFYKEGFKTKTYVDRTSQFCIFAVGQTIQPLIDGLDLHRVGLITASNFGCLDSASKYLYELSTLPKPKYASPLFFTHSICNIPNSLATIEAGMKGYSNHLVGSSESGLLTIWQGINCINSGQMDYMIVGGVDTLNQELLNKLKDLRIINPSCNLNDIKGPFVNDRRYPIWAEGAAFLGIESYQHASQNNRNIYGVIKGYGISNRINKKDNSIIRSMTKALEKAKVSPNSISYILANANGSQMGDLQEAEAIYEVFGGETPVVALKSYFGETSAAASLMSICSLLALKGSNLPQNPGLMNIDDNIRINLQSNNIKIQTGDLCIINGYSRQGTSVSFCIQVN